MRRDRNTLVVIERVTKTKDDYNQVQEAWAPVGEEWAEVFYGRGDERRQAASERAAQAATFQMDANALTLGLTPEDRLRADNAVWNIHGIAPDTPRPGDVEITTSRED